MSNNQRNTPHDQLTDEQQRRADELFEQWLPWLRFEAAIQAQKESTGFAAIGAGTLLTVEFPEFYTRSGEADYRRGYVHGYSRGMDDMVDAGARQGKAWNACARFFDGDLCDWSRGDCDRTTLPPFFDPRRWAA